MMWKTVAECLPPIDKEILFGYVAYLGYRNEFRFGWGCIRRPFNDDKKWNPDYYVAYSRTCNETIIEERELSPYDLWTEIEIPESVAKEICKKESYRGV